MNTTIDTDTAQHEWWCVYEMTWEATHFTQREPWLRCACGCGNA